MRRPTKAAVFPNDMLPPGADPLAVFARSNPLSTSRSPCLAEQYRRRELVLVERVYSRLKDEFGARSIAVPGASKVMAHLMFGVLALTLDQLLKLPPNRLTGR